MHYQESKPLLSERLEQLSPIIFGTVFSSLIIYIAIKEQRPEMLLHLIVIAISFLPETLRRRLYVWVTYISLGVLAYGLSAGQFDIDDLSRPFRDWGLYHFAICVLVLDLIFLAIEYLRQGWKNKKTKIQNRLPPS